jgi:hypothetical protein
MSQHADYKFSVTIHSDELALISYMRGLSEHCQIDGNKRIPWGNTKEKDWASANHQVTFHFNRQNHRDNFFNEAKNLFKETLWSIKGQSNNDPARRAD